MPRETSLIVRVEIIGARGLAERDKSLKYWHLADPYAILKLLENGVEIERYETAAARATLAPEWDEVHCFRVAATRD